MSQVPVKWVPEVCMLDARQGQAKTPVVPPLLAAGGGGGVGETSNERSI